MSTRSHLVLSLLALAVARGAGATDLSKSQCLALKLRTAGTFQACRANRAAQALLGRGAEPAPCETRFAKALARLDQRAARNGVGCRFQDLGDGTVLDVSTGLQWEKKRALDGLKNFGDPHDADNNYTWTNEPFVDPDEGGTARRSRHTVRRSRSSSGP